MKGTAFNKCCKPSQVTLRSSAMVMPTKYYSLSSKIFLFLKDIYGIGLAYTVSMNHRFKISSIILYTYKMLFLLIYRKRVDKASWNNKKWGEKGTSTSAIAMSFFTISPAPFRSGLTFSLPFIMGCWAAHRNLSYWLSCPLSD